MLKSIIIIGMSQGLSMGIAEKFGNEGFTVGMINKSEEKLKQYHQQLKSSKINSLFATADVSDVNQLQKALKQIVTQTSGLDILVYNAVDHRTKNIIKENIHDLTKGFIVGAVKEFLPLIIASKGSILLTGGGAANYPNSDTGSVTFGKIGIKNLAYQLNNAFKKRGVYVGTITVSAWIHPDSNTHTPKVIAEKFWDLNNNRNKVEIVY